MVRLRIPSLVRVRIPCLVRVRIPILVRMRIDMSGSLSTSRCGEIMRRCSADCAEVAHR